MPQVAAAIREAVPSLAKDEFTDISVSYLAAICGTLMNIKHSSEEQWKEVGLILSLLTKNVPAGAADTIKNKCADMMIADEVADDDEDAEELCNCQFTLAYGKFSMRDVQRFCKEVRDNPKGGAPIFEAILFEVDEIRNGSDF